MCAPTEPRPHRFAAENATEQRCRYFSKARKFVCRVKVPPSTDDTKPLVVSTCVNNGAGGSAGEDRIITLSSICECRSLLAGGWDRLSGTVPGPEPPPFPGSEARPPPERDSGGAGEGTTVAAGQLVLPLVLGPPLLLAPLPGPLSPRARPDLHGGETPPPPPFPAWGCLPALARLSPTSCCPCPLQVDQVTTTWLDIRDAWRGTRHVVQVRAQEEFGHGAWSEWSREAVGTPWTGRRGTCGPEAGG